MDHSIPRATSPMQNIHYSTHTHRGFNIPDPFAPRKQPGISFINALLATAIFRCWHILLFFSGWSTLITVLNHNGRNLSIQPTLLTVIGTVLGFVISYRTTSSFERYNEGRRLWSQIIASTRTFARTVWFHVPDPKGKDAASTDELKGRSMIEKKTVINLLEAFSVAVKHYLRGEDGIYYQDLYYLVKFLPAYALPAGMPSMEMLPDEVGRAESSSVKRNSTSLENSYPSLDRQSSPLHHRNPLATSDLPTPVTSAVHPKTTFVEPGDHQRKKDPQQPHPRGSHLHIPMPNISGRSPYRKTKDRSRHILSKEEEADLTPASIPPKYAIFDLFPFSLLGNLLTENGRDVGGKKAARLRAKMLSRAISHNLPLELSLYLSSYISSLQSRDIADVPTINTLLTALTQLVDSLTELERILTTPIPFSYSIHLWLVTVIYCFTLPIQIWDSLHWFTIPATIIASFIFFGFLVAGEEIENPFGYDKNDLNLDHFTNSIIRNELRAVTSTSPPDPTHWAFVPENNLLFSAHNDDRIAPDEWLNAGHHRMQQALGRMP